MSEVDGLREDVPIMTNLKRRLRFPSSRQRPGRGPPDSTSIGRLTKGQKWIFLSFMLSLLLHITSTLLVILMLRPAAFLMVFHGIVSPSTLILYVVGALSGIYGYGAIFTNDEWLSEERRSALFRYYMRANKLILLVWILASQGTVFGCWKYVFALNLDKQIPFEDLVGMAHMDTIVRLTIVSMPSLLDDLTLEHGITATTPPLNWLGVIGSHYVVFLLVFTAFPTCLFWWGIRAQRRYYTMRFMSN